MCMTCVSTNWGLNPGFSSERPAGHHRTNRTDKSNILSVCWGSSSYILESIQTSHLLVENLRKVYLLSGLQTQVLTDLCCSDLVVVNFSELKLENV